VVVSHPWSRPDSPAFDAGRVRLHIAMLAVRPLEHVTAVGAARCLAVLVLAAACAAGPSGDAESLLGALAEIDFIPPAASLLGQMQTLLDLECMALLQRWDALRLVELSAVVDSASLARGALFAGASCAMLREAWLAFLRVREHRPFELRFRTEHFWLRIRNRR
jgi:hypothetical protein